MKMIIDIINKTKIPDEELQNFTDIFNEKLEDFCNDWKIEKPLIKYVPKIWPSFEKIKVTLNETQTENAFHGCKNNIPYGNVCIINQDFSRLLSHEIFEILINPYMKEYFEFEGKRYKKEVCDPVTLNTFEISGIKISDWVLPSWYNLDSKGPYNHLNTLKNPFQIDNGGYID
jgi:hypothetical protein